MPTLSQARSDSARSSDRPLPVDSRRLSRNVTQSSKPGKCTQCEDLLRHLHAKNVELVKMRDELGRVQLFRDQMKAAAAEGGDGHHQTKATTTAASASSTVIAPIRRSRELRASSAPGSDDASAAGDVRRIAVLIERNAQLAIDRDAFKSKAAELQARVDELERALADALQSSPTVGTDAEGGHLLMRSSSRRSAAAASPDASRRSMTPEVPSGRYSRNSAFIPGEDGCTSRSRPESNVVSRVATPRVRRSESASAAIATGSAQSSPESGAAAARRSKSAGASTLRIGAADAATPTIQLARQQAAGVRATSPSPTAPRRYPAFGSSVPSRRGDLPRGASAASASSSSPRNGWMSPNLALLSEEPAVTTAPHRGPRVSATRPGAAGVAFPRLAALDPTRRQRSRDVAELMEWQTEDVRAAGSSRGAHHRVATPRSLSPRDPVQPTIATAVPMLVVSPKTEERAALNAQIAELRSRVIRVDRDLYHVLQDVHHADDVGRPFRIAHEAVKQIVAFHALPTMNRLATSTSTATVVSAAPGPWPVKSEQLDAIPVGLAQPLAANLKRLVAAHDYLRAEHRVAMHVDLCRTLRDFEANLDLFLELTQQPQVRMHLQ